MAQLPNIKSHMREIIGCPIVQQCLNGDNSHPCAVLVNSQEKSKPFHVPTPWVGNLKDARVLMVSSNPSIDIGELYPAGHLYNGDHFVGNEEWLTEDEVFDYFNNLFKGSHYKKWVSDRRVLGKDGKYRQKNRYWGAVQKLTRELLGSDAKLGEDVAITEIVRCKSKRERDGVDQAATVCPERYLEKTLQLSGADVIIFAGKFAVQTFRKRYRDDISVPPNAHREGHISGPHRIKSLGTRERYFAFLPHPTGTHGPSNFTALFKDEARYKQLENLRNFLKNDRGL
ncbi:MAG: uracil-DNA glycosylase family protein [Chloroflexota bacterium]